MLMCSRDNARFREVDPGECRQGAGRRRRRVWAAARPRQCSCGGLACQLRWPRAPPGMMRHSPTDYSCRPVRQADARVFHGSALDGGLPHQQQRRGRGQRGRRQRQRQRQRRGEPPAAAHCRQQARPSWMRRGLLGLLVLLLLLHSYLCCLKHGASRPNASAALPTTGSCPPAGALCSSAAAAPRRQVHGPIPVPHMPSQPPRCWRQATPALSRLPACG